MAQPTTTRRALLSAATTALAYAGGAAIVGGAAVVATEAKSQTVTSAAMAWQKAMAACDRARKADDEINAIFAKVEDARSADLDALPPFSDACRRHFFGANKWKILATDVDAHEQEWFAKKGLIWNAPDSRDDEYRAIFNEVRAHQAQRKAIDAKHNFHAISSEWDRLGEVLSDAEWAAFYTPAPDHAALAWKIEMIARRGRPFEGTEAGMILADVRRLGGEAQA